MSQRNPAMMPEDSTLKIRYPSLTVEQAKAAWMEGRPVEEPSIYRRPEDAQKIAEYNSRIAVQQGNKYLAEKYGEDWYDKLNKVDLNEKISVEIAGETYRIQARDLWKAKADEQFARDINQRLELQELGETSKRIEEYTGKKLDFSRVDAMPQKTPEQAIAKAEAAKRGGYITDTEYNRVVTANKAVIEYNAKIEEVNAIKDANAQWAKAIEYGLKTQAEYDAAKRLAQSKGVSTEPKPRLEANLDVKAHLMAEREPVHKTQYAVDYRIGGEKGRDAVAYFDTVEEAVKFTETRPDISPTYKVSTLTSDGKTVTRSFNDQNQAERYADTLREKEVKEALSPAGLSQRLYDWGEKFGDENWKNKPLSERDLGDFIQSQTEYYSATFGSGMLNPLEDTVAVVFRALGKADLVYGGAESVRQMSREALAKYEKLSEPQKIYVAAGTVGATFLGSYAAALPVGVVAGRVMSASAQIAARLGMNSASAVGKIASTIAANPKLMQAMVWAPIVGVEASKVYEDYKAGVSQDEILSRLAIRGAGIVGGVKGFEKGISLGLNKAEVATLRKLEEEYEFARGSMKVEEPTGRLIGVTESKYIPKDLAKFLSEELPQLKGDEVAVGFAKIGTGKDAIEVPVTTKYGELIKQLKDAKAVSVDAYERALLNALPPEKYGLLYVKAFASTKNVSYGSILELTPDEVAQLAYKELGYGSPWANSDSIKRTLVFGSREGGMSNVLALITPEEAAKIGLDAKAVKTWNEVAKSGSELPTIKPSSETVKLWTGDEKAAASALSRGYNTLINRGLSQDQAAAVLEIVSGDLNANQALLATIKLDLAPGQREAAAVVALALTRMDVGERLRDVGVSASQAPMVIQVITDPRSVEVNAVKLDRVSVNFVAPLLDRVTLSRIKPEALSSLILKMDNATVLDVSTRLDTRQLNRITPESLNSLVTRLDSKLKTEALSRLTPDSLSKIVPMQSDAQIAETIQGLTVPQISALITRLDVDQQRVTDIAMDTLSEVDRFRLSQRLPFGLTLRKPREKELDEGDKEEKKIKDKKLFFLVRVVSSGGSYTRRVEAESHVEAYRKAGVGGSPLRVSLRRLGKT